MIHSPTESGAISGRDEIPEEELDQRRNVAEHLDVDARDRREKPRRQGPRDAGADADEERNGPTAEADQHGPAETRPEPLPVGLAEKDPPVPGVVHAVATVCSGIRRAAKRFWICIGALKIPLYWNSPISHHRCQEAFPGDLTAALMRTLRGVHCPQDVHGQGFFVNWRRPAVSPADSPSGSSRSLATICRSVRTLDIVKAV